MVKVGAGCGVEGEKETEDMRDDTEKGWSLSPNWMRS
jgi:hypothetical protein